MENVHEGKEFELGEYGLFIVCIVDCSIVCSIVVGSCCQYFFLKEPFMVCIYCIRNVERLKQ